MSGITDAVFRNLGFRVAPGTDRVRANASPLGPEIDGILPDEPRDSYVSSAEAFESVLSQGETPAREVLREAGMEDPLEITPEVESSAAELVERHQPQDQMETAILFMQATMPPESTFLISTDVPLTEEQINGDQPLSPTVRTGIALSLEDGNLGITPNDDLESPVRSEGGAFSGTNTGNLTPTELLRLSPQRRIARCLEYAFVLCSWFRSVGMEADIVREPHHAYVVVNIEGANYRIDPARGVFTRTNAAPMTERQAIAMHYCNEGEALVAQRRYGEAVSTLTISTELDPFAFQTWQGLGQALRGMGSIDDAIDCYARALDLETSPALLREAVDVFYPRLAEVDGRIRTARAVQRVAERVAAAERTGSTPSQEDLAFLAQYTEEERLADTAIMSHYQDIIRDNPALNQALMARMGEETGN
ncbi:MAG: hypothetical protein WCT39_03595 [Candidatus Margulisiibacteriota bacterium]